MRSPRVCVQSTGDVTILIVFAMPSPGGSNASSPDSAERRELDYLFSIAYEELRRLAARVRLGDPSATLNTTALVNEAWIKLAASPKFASTSRLHFKRIAARAMRQLLVEAARRRMTEKRGGGAISVTVEESSAFTEATELLALDTALDQLATVSPRQAQLVEARFFGGLDVAETAELLEISEATVLRDWRAAKAWLAHELRNPGAEIFGLPPGR